MRRALPFLLSAFCFQLFGADPVPPSTSFSRTLLRAPDAATARTILGTSSSTNGIAPLDGYGTNTHLYSPIFEDRDVLTNNRSAPTTFKHNVLLTNAGFNVNNLFRVDTAGAAKADKFIGENGATGFYGNGAGLSNVVDSTAQRASEALTNWAAITITNAPFSNSIPFATSATTGKWTRDGSGLTNIATGIGDFVLAANNFATGSNFFGNTLALTGPVRDSAGVSRLAFGTSTKLNTDQGDTFIEAQSNGTTNTTIGYPGGGAGNTYIQFQDGEMIFSVPPAQSGQTDRALMIQADGKIRLQTGFSLSTTNNMGRTAHQMISTNETRYTLIETLEVLNFIAPNTVAWASGSLTLGWPTRYHEHSVTSNSWVTGFSGVMANKTLSAFITVTNATASDFTLSVSNSVTSTDGLRSWTVTNKTSRGFSFKVGSETNASSAPLY